MKHVAVGIVLHIVSILMLIFSLIAVLMVTYTPSSSAPLIPTHICFRENYI